MLKSLLLMLLLFTAACASLPKEQPKPEEGTKTFCTSDQRKADVCIALYQPVCGWFDTTKIKTYSNSCAACKDQKVQYWTEGECPQ